MPSVKITINQAAKPVGVVGTAREDLSTGTKVTLTAGGGFFLSYLWEILDVPINYATVAISAAGLATPAASSTDMLPIDVEGTYRVRVSVDSGSGLGATASDVAEITFYAGSTLSATYNQLPRRVPAYGETVEHNVAQAAGLGATKNKRGWAMELDRWFRVVIAHGSAIAGFSAVGTWYVEDQTVAADGDTVFDVAHLISTNGLTNVQFVLNGSVQRAADFASSNIAGHGRVTYAPTGDSPSTRAGWTVQIRYLSA